MIIARSVAIVGGAKIVVAVYAVIFVPSVLVVLVAEIVTIVSGAKPVSIVKTLKIVTNILVTESLMMPPLHQHSFF